MAEKLETTEANNKTIYTFCFSTSNERVHLNQQQLDHIPYLSTLVEHKDDFLSIQNENGEYMLNPPINYNWFMVIFHSITSEQPYTLFTKLPEDENVLDILQLFDYLGLNSFTPPLLKGKDLVLSNPTNDTHEKRHVEYHHANLSEARNTAAQFIISISKNVYDLHHLDTLQSVFDLIMIIFSNNNVFSSRFRHHTLTIIKEYCRSLLPKQQQHKLPTLQQIAQNSIMDSWTYLYDDDQSLPENFENAFAWKGVYKVIEKYGTIDHLRSLKIIIYGTSGVGKSAIINYLLKDIETEDFQHHTDDSLFSSTHLLLNEYDQYDFWSNFAYDEVSLINENRNDKESYIDEAKSARSGHFNTLPKRPNVDKFKHRFSSKAQKYR